MRVARRRKKPAEPVVDRRIAERRELEDRLAAFLDGPPSAVESVDDFVDSVGSRGALLVPALVRALGHADPRRRAVVRAVLSAVLDVEALGALVREARKPGLPAVVRRDALVLCLAVDPEGRAGALRPDELEVAAQGSLSAVLDGLVLDPGSSGEIAALYREMPPAGRRALVEEAARTDPDVDPALFDARKLLVAMDLLSVETDPQLRERLVDLAAGATPPEALFALQLVEAAARTDDEAKAARRHAMRLRTAGHVAASRDACALRTGADSEGRIVHALAVPAVAGHWDVVAGRVAEDGRLEEIVRHRTAGDPRAAIDETDVAPEDVPVARAPWSEVAAELARACAGARDPEAKQLVEGAARGRGVDDVVWADPPARPMPGADWLREHLAGWRADVDGALWREIEADANRIVERGGGDAAKMLRDARALAARRLGSVPAATWRRLADRTRQHARAAAASGDADLGGALWTAAATLDAAPPSGAWAEMLLARGILRRVVPMDDEPDETLRGPLRKAIRAEASDDPTKAHLLTLDVASVAASAAVEALPHLERTHGSLARLLFAAFAVGRSVASALEGPARQSLPSIDGLSSMPSSAVAAVEAAVDDALRKVLDDAGAEARAEVAGEVVAFVRALCFGACPHRCPARRRETAGSLFEAAEPWDVEG
jgi:hypothetical protein